MKTSNIYLLLVTVVAIMSAGSAFAGLVQRVPEPASTLTLLGMSLSGLVIGRQMLRK